MDMNKGGGIAWGELGVLGGVKGEKLGELLTAQSIKYVYPWLVWLCGWVPACDSKGHQFDSWSRAHARIVGRVPSKGCTRGNHTLMLVSLSFPLPSPL